MATTPKDTIYVDIDDEITGIIDKVKNSPSKVVALVLPKRASVFQSIVNMKLLKRAADNNKKNVILITAEAGLLPLAGSAGIHVAKTLNSKPEIPLGPNAIVDSDEAVDEDAALSDFAINDEPELDKTKPIGALSAATSAKLGREDLETVTIDNSDPDEADQANNPDNKTAKAKPPKKNKSLKIPNFNRFRLILGLLGLLIIVLIVGFFVLNAALQKATINIRTNASNVPVSLNLNLSTSASSLDTSTDTLPSQYVQTQKTFSEQVPTTGQMNEGAKANGTITVVVNGACSAPDIPAGTGATANGQTYIIEDDITFQTGTVNKGNCQLQGTDATNPNNGNNIPIVAQSGGSAYNVNNATFTIDDSSGNLYTATGSASGGTDDLVQVVNQNDITNAENKISVGNASVIKSDLENQLTSQGYYPVIATFSPGTPSITPSATVGSAANTVTVTENITYSMYGIYKSQLEKLIATSLNGQINSKSQSILNYGLSSANIGVNTQNNKTAQITLDTTAVIGPNLNITNIKKEVAGKKVGTIKSIISANPNVTSVNISFSPFWVSSAPSNLSKINVIIAKPTNK